MGSLICPRHTKIQSMHINDQNLDYVNPVVIFIDEEIL